MSTGKQNETGHAGMTKYRKGPERSIKQDHRGSAIPQRTTKEHTTGPQRIGNHEKTARLATIWWIFFANSVIYNFVMLLFFVNFGVLMRLNDL